MHFTFRFCII